MQLILKQILSLTGSQCSLSRAALAESYLRLPVRNLAAAFWMACSLLKGLSRNLDVGWELYQCSKIWKSITRGRYCSKNELPKLFGVEVIASWMHNNCCYQFCLLATPPAAILWDFHFHFNCNHIKVMWRPYMAPNERHLFEWVLLPFPSSFLA